MLIQSSVTDEYKALMKQVSGEADAGLQGLLAEVAAAPVIEQREAVFDVLPTLGGLYADASAEVSSVFFEALMEVQEVPKLVLPDIVEPVERGRWDSLAGWATADRVFEKGGLALVFSLLTGGLSKILAESAADTMIGNAGIQSMPMRSQRVPSAGCCGFCGMLASRFAGYTSQESAGKVVGRGIPVGEGRGKGSKGRGRGLKARGARELGEDFHDHCRCAIVIVTEDNEVQLQKLADSYYDSYRDAYDKADKGLIRVVKQHKASDGSLKNKYSWADNDGKAVSPEGRVKMIVGAMRDDLGVR